MYRPQRVNITSTAINHATDIEVYEEIIPNSDIIIFDHGLHYTPQDQTLFYNEMYNYLFLFKHKQQQQYKQKENDRNDFPLVLIWRETSTQHFDTIYGDGHYYIKNANNNLTQKSKLCVPITNHSTTLSNNSGAPFTRMSIMKNISQNLLGYKWYNVLYNDNFMNIEKTQTKNLTLYGMYFLNKTLGRR